MEKSAKIPKINGAALLGALKSLPGKGRAMAGAVAEGAKGQGAEVFSKVIGANKGKPWIIPHAGDKWFESIMLRPFANLAADARTIASTSRASKLGPLTLQQQLAAGTAKLRVPGEIGGALASTAALVPVGVVGKSLVDQFSDKTAAYERGFRDRIEKLAQVVQGQPVQPAKPFVHKDMYGNVVMDPKFDPDQASGEDILTATHKGGFGSSFSRGLSKLHGRLSPFSTGEEAWNRRVKAQARQIRSREAETWAQERAAIAEDERNRRMREIGPAALAQEEAKKRMEDTAKWNAEYEKANPSVFNRNYNASGLNMFGQANPTNSLPAYLRSLPAPVPASPAAAPNSIPPAPATKMPAPASTPMSVPNPRATVTPRRAVAPTPAVVTPPGQTPPPAKPAVLTPPRIAARNGQPQLKPVQKPQGNAGANAFRV